MQQFCLQNTFKLDFNSVSHRRFLENDAIILLAG